MLRAARRLRLAAVLSLGVAAAPALAGKSQSISIPGLEEPAEIRVDRWGVAHLYAESERDLFFVQGFNAARDRLFQIDLWRRRGLGQLAAVFGREFAEQDRAARLFLYRGDMDREWRMYDAGGTHAARTVAQRFADGVNAYIDWLDANPERLPWEFTFAGYRPARWAADDIVRIRSHGLTRNLGSEVARAQTLCIAGDVAVDEIRFGLSNGWKARVPEDGEVFWPSPWGEGRPGWHIECSAMSMDLLGPSFDLHLGGEDLIFPHHEDEIAQSEGAGVQPPGQPFVKHWVHCAHLLVEGKKMAKSLGISQTGFRVVINSGRNGGETVPHLHVHLLGGRPLNWPPG